MKGGREGERGRERGRDGGREGGREGVKEKEKELLPGHIGRKLVHSWDTARIQTKLPDAECKCSTHHKHICLEGHWKGRCLDSTRPQRSLCSSSVDEIHVKCALRIHLVHLNISQLPENLLGAYQQVSFWRPPLTHRMVIWGAGYGLGLKSQ